jgi:NADPH:quinone reductase-like Zn-dependent oxidoreductase
MDEQETGTTMQAVRLHRAGGAWSVAVETVLIPTPASDEVLVRVCAAAITRGELEWPEDRLPAIPSYEVSGVVAPSGPEAGLEVGEAVFGLTAFDRDGVAAGFAAVPARFLAQKPANLTHVDAAALPMAALTSWQALFTHGALEPDERVMIVGAVGGVGHVATQLARWKGAHVVAVAAADDADLAKGLGADEVLLPESLGRADAALAPVDLVFDTAGGNLLRRAPAHLRTGGRLVSVAEEPAAPSPTGAFTTAYFVVEPVRAQLEEIARLAGSGDLGPMVDAVYPLAEARTAFERTEARGKRGKVVLRLPGREEA